MSKTIKIIDLLNKIANGEEPPEKIRIAGHRYKYNKETKDYDSDIGFDNKDLFLHIGILQELNTPIIIEDEQEIDIQNIGELTYKGEKVGYGSTEQFTDDIDDYCSAINSILDTIGLKINQLVQTVKYLDNKLKEK